MPLVRIFHRYPAAKQAMDRIYALIRFTWIGDVPMLGREELWVRWRNKWASSGLFQGLFVLSVSWSLVLLGSGIVFYQPIRRERWLLAVYYALRQLSEQNAVVHLVILGLTRVKDCSLLTWWSRSVCSGSEVCGSRDNSGYSYLPRTYYVYNRPSRFSPEVSKIVSVDNHSRREPRFRPGNCTCTSQRKGC